MTLLAERRTAHEKHKLSGLRATRNSSVEIATSGSLAARAAAALDALRSGVDVVYQVEQKDVIQ